MGVLTILGVVLLIAFCIIMPIIGIPLVLLLIVVVIIKRLFVGGAKVAGKGVTAIRKGAQKKDGTEDDTEDQEKE